MSTGKGNFINRLTNDTKHLSNFNWSMLSKLVEKYKWYDKRAINNFLSLCGFFVRPSGLKVEGIIIYKKIQSLCFCFQNIHFYILLSDDDCFYRILVNDKYNGYGLQYLQKEI